MSRKKIILSFLLWAISVIAYTHDNIEIFIENKGQWDSRILFSRTLPDGNLYLEKNGFTYMLIDQSFIRDFHHNKDIEPPKFIQGHAIQTKFIGANPNVKILKKDSSSFYHNYFLGKNPAKWKSKVRSFSDITYQSLYPFIDLRVYDAQENTKYDFEVYPGGDVNQIKVKYTGAEAIFVQNGNLYVINKVNDIIEQAPYAYQLINGEKIEVACEFVLTDNVLSYHFPNGYDQTQTLIVDPVIVFSTFSGSTANNFGFTATYDNAGNAYGGGIVLSTGIYPTSPGAFQANFYDSTGAFDIWDMAISKYSADGTTLMYSTYIGGEGTDAPHSLVVNNADELFVMGTSSSVNYPVSATAFDTSFNGGPSTVPYLSGMRYSQGTDIVITKLNATGTAMLGSTYIGGTANDGLNDVNGLAYVYGDAFRGEIIVDGAGNCVVASVTNSTDFPFDSLTSVIQPTYGGGLSDGVVFKLDATLENMLWGTYLGGDSTDAAYGTQFDSNGDVFVSGGTISSNFPTTPNALDTSYNGREDGFVTRYNPTTNVMVASTYVGTAGYDQSYFVQLDLNDDVYIAGQSDGNYPIKGNVYTDSNSGQFIQKLGHNLDTSIWSTQVGSGRGTVDLALTAFLVNNCGYVYLAGWGGFLGGIGLYRANLSSTFGLPTTPDAFQSTTNGRDFYLMVLNNEGANLLYGTYFGGPFSSEHVDGGTSRFDKEGNVYQAVCAGCGGRSDMFTSTGAYSDSNRSSCNMAIFKFNLEHIEPIATAPLPFVCLPDSVSFTNNSSGGNTYWWDFGDGDTSTLFEPTHVYADTGSYSVRLIVSDSTGCSPPDTADIIIDVYRPKLITINPVDTICVGDTVQINASGGQVHSWTPASSIVNDTVESPFVFPDTTTTYQYISRHYCNTDTGYITVPVQTQAISIDNDTTICEGTTVQLSAYGGVTYTWYPALDIVNENTASPFFTPTVPRMYYVDVVTSLGCEFTDSVYIDFHLDSITIIPDTAICIGDNIRLNATGGGTYLWSPFASLNDSSLANPIAMPAQTTSYVVDVVSPNGCLLQDSMLVTVYDDPYTVTPDTGVCIGDSVYLVAAGAVNYQWNSLAYIHQDSLANTTGYTTVDSSFYVTLTFANGCVKHDTVRVEVYQNNVTTRPDTTICEGTSVQLLASGGALYSWSPAIGLTNGNTSTPTVTPPAPMYYYVDVTTTEGCTFTDSVFVDFYLDSITIIADTGICIGNNIQLNATGGGTYLWSPFASLNDSSLANPIAAPTQTTVYVVDVISLNGCLLQDSVTITVHDEPHTIIPDTAICYGDSIRLFATGGGTYSWLPTGSLSNASIVNPMATPFVTTPYVLEIVTTNNCIIRDTATVTVHNEPIEVIGDTVICIGGTAQLQASGGTAYNWTPNGTLNSGVVATPLATPALSQMYMVNVTTPSGCIKTDSVRVVVDTVIPRPTISNDTTICVGDTIPLFAGGANKIIWSPHNTLVTNNGVSNRAFPRTTQTYVVEYANTCGVDYDSVTVTVNYVNGSIIGNDIICNTDSIWLQATGGISYSWSGSEGIISRTDSSAVLVNPVNPTTYFVSITNSLGCVEELSESISFYPVPEIEAGENKNIIIGDYASLNAVGTDGAIAWAPPEGLSCTNCLSPVANPDQNTTYTVQVTDSNGCVATDNVTVFLDGTLYVPNTFSPDGDGINDYFGPKAEGVIDYKFWIFNRWGELLYETDDIGKPWDGRYKGKLVKTDTYVWRIKYKKAFGERVEVIGHVNVLR